MVSITQRKPASLRVLPNGTGLQMLALQCPPCPSPIPISPGYPLFEVDLIVLGHP